MFTFYCANMKLRNLLVTSVDVDGIQFNPPTQILKYANMVNMIWSVDAETQNAAYVTYSQQTSVGRLLLFVSSLALVSQPDMFE